MVSAISFELKVYGSCMCHHQSSNVFIYRKNRNVKLQTLRNNKQETSI